MRIRVRVDTSKPLCQGCKIFLEGGKVSWVRFKYERLPNLCYWCGLLTHNDKDCDLWVQSSGNLTEQDQQFDGWLRAPTTLPRKCSVVKVGGHDKEDAREVTRPLAALANEDRNSNEEDDQGVSQSDVVPIGSGRSEGVIKDRMETSEHLGDELGRNNEDFQEIVNEIDVGLSKYDGPAMNFPLPRIKTGLILPSGAAKSLEVQLLSPIVGSFQLGGQIRRWKRLA